MVNCVAHFGIVDQLSMKCRSKSLLMKPGALAVELVRQPAGADHDDALVARPSCDRAADRRAQRVAALWPTAADAARC